jgi:preprotein translocase subunit SecA
MDDVINIHRDVVYKLRRKILELEDGNEENKEWFLTNLQSNSSFASDIWNEKEKIFGKDMWLKIVCELSLPVIDLMWIEHLVDMDQVREGIGLRGYAQRDPMVEYKKEGHERFGILISRIYSTIGERLSYVTGQVKEEKKKPLSNRNIIYQHGEIESGLKDERESASVLDSMGRKIRVQSVSNNQTQKVGRNDPCPCGSGKKYKKCCYPKYD